MSQVKVFSATMALDRDKLAARINEWIREEGVLVERLILRLTSDAAFHCLTAVAQYRKGDKSPKGIIHELPDGGRRVFATIEFHVATKAKEREVLGQRVGELTAHDHMEVLQSSDEAFHCVVLAVFRGQRLAACVWIRQPAPPAFARARAVSCPRARARFGLVA